MPSIVDIKTAFPKHYYKQEQLIEAMTGFWKGKIQNTSRIASIHQNVLVKGRHLVLPLEDYLSGLTFDQKNKIFIENAVELAVQSISKILEQNNLEASDISSLWSNTVTGFAIPSLDARVMNKLPFRPNTKRVPILGLGCMAGAAGINRVADYLKGHPEEAVIFFSVELCSLTIQLSDISVENLISTGLFGDGAAAVLMVGDDHPLSKTAPLEWMASEGVFFPDTETVMGWDVGEKGLKIILSKSVPKVTAFDLPKPLMHFLSHKHLQLNDINSFIAHPGGPKVLSALEKVLHLPPMGLNHSWESLAENGNMSSVSVLDIFERTIKNRPEDNRGSLALSIAMGPAFSAEMGLFKWK